jgi:adenosylmethionine-8-amino-7-oxononanoate transaminase
MGLNNQWMQRDLAVLWHPCTQMKDHEQLPLIPIKRGEGVWLEDFEGKRYLDAVSSWWVNVFGHANPRINQRIKDQVDQLEHVILAGFSHQPVIELSERLVKMTPEGLTRCFYADNGSSCIEVAMKMSFHYWINRGQPAKKRFVTLSNSYHGETIAAMSVGDVPLFTETYKALLLDTIKVPSPDCYHRPEGMGWEEHSRNMFAAMEQTLAEHHGSVAAVIVEPLIQGAGGMRMYHPVYLKLLREACDRYGVHLIHDEIAVGFGRTGTMFACEQAGITPDFLCLSKALTGGYLPLAACVTTDDVYNAFYDDSTSSKKTTSSRPTWPWPSAWRAPPRTWPITRTWQKSARPAWCWPSRWSRTRPAKPLTPGRNAVAWRCSSMPWSAVLYCGRWAAWSIFCHRMSSPRSRSISSPKWPAKASTLPPGTRSAWRCRRTSILAIAIRADDKFLCGEGACSRWAA